MMGLLAAESSGQTVYCSLCTVNANGQNGSDLMYCKEP